LDKIKKDEPLIRPTDKNVGIALAVALAAWILFAIGALFCLKKILDPSIFQ